jgi:hypothetical protein
LTARSIVALALLVGSLGAAATPASAQQYNRYGVPAYNGWQDSWDRFEYDRHHVILGTVSDFKPFRLTIQRRDGVVQMIDLKNGTVILPTGATPNLTQRVAIVGYYSRGTFVANRVILHN